MNTLKRWREENGLTQEQAARMVDVTLRTWVNLERGHFDMRASTARKLARVMGDGCHRGLPRGAVAWANFRANFLSAKRLRPFAPTVRHRRSGEVLASYGKTCPGLLIRRFGVRVPAGPRAATVWLRLTRDVSAPADG